MIFLALLKWNELPVSVRRSRKRLYNYIKSEIEGDTQADGLLAGRVEVLEGKTDNDTIYDDTNIISRLEYLESYYSRDLTFTVESGDPAAGVEDAVVAIAGKTATTNSSGIATVNGVLDGTHEVTVTCEGYETSTSEKSVDSTHTSFTITLTAVTPEEPEEQSET